MWKFVTALAMIVLSTSLSSPSNAAGPKRDAATCHKMLEGNPAYFVQGRRTKAYGPAIRRCRAGESV
jgi:hypothetical protein